jgi:hypothetical protein
MSGIGPKPSRTPPVKAPLKPPVKSPAKAKEAVEPRATVNAEAMKGRPEAAKDPGQDAAGGKAQPAADKPRLGKPPLPGKSSDPKSVGKVRSARGAQADAAKKPGAVDEATTGPRDDTGVSSLPHRHRVSEPGKASSPTGAGSPKAGGQKSPTERTTDQAFGPPGLVDPALPSARSPEAAEKLARQALEVMAETLSGSKLDFSRTDAGIDVSTIKSLLEAFAKRSNTTGLPAGRAPQAGFPPLAPLATDDVSEAQSQSDWAKPISVPVVPMVAESDAGLSDIKSIRRQIGPFTFEGSVQQWVADLPRFLLSQPTTGERVDTTAMLTVGGESFRVGIGRVTATADGVIADLETQRADIAQLTIGPLTLSIWNDTRHNTDQSVYTGGGKTEGDTARWKVTLGDYRLDRISLGFRVGTGIPDRSQTERVGDHRLYKPEAIKYSDASKGHLIASGTFLSTDGREIELTGILSSGDAQNLIQSKLLHTGLGLAPEFPNTNEVAVFVNAAFRF